MLFDSGKAQICELVVNPDLGLMPSPKIKTLCTQFFGERQISYSRQYQAKGADEQVDMLIRIWKESTRPKIGMIAILSDYDGQENKSGDQFRVDNVQPTIDDDGLGVYDLTLSRLEKRYENV
ncbi:MAG: hypothetical protein WCS21_05505 [Lachnospiraceae bacterium]